MTSDKTEKVTKTVDGIRRFRCIMLMTTTRSMAASISVSATAIASMIVAIIEPGS